MAFSARTAWHTRRELWRIGSGPKGRLLCSVRVAVRVLWTGVDGAAPGYDLVTWVAAGYDERSGGWARSVGGGVFRCGVFAACPVVSAAAGAGVAGGGRRAGAGVRCDRGGGVERAFFGDQLGELLPVLNRHGVGLWLPEVGGRLDAADPVHVAVVRVLGAQSKREVVRARSRVLAAMQVQVREEGRYLGGRPPYGYRLVDAGAHPNGEHARWGRRRQRLAVDPVTGPQVCWMFAQRLAGMSAAGIARSLIEHGVACPSVVDPTRNRHRHAGCGRCGVWRRFWGIRGLRGGRCGIANRWITAAMMATGSWWVSGGGGVVRGSGWCRGVGRIRRWSVRRISSRRRRSRHGSDRATVRSGGMRWWVWCGAGYAVVGWSRAGYTAARVIGVGTAIPAVKRPRLAFECRTCIDARTGSSIRSPTGSNPAVSGPGIRRRRSRWTSLRPYERTS
jgi:hypothetical protein